MPDTQQPFLWDDDDVAHLIELAWIKAAIPPKEGICPYAIINEYKADKQKPKEPEQRPWQILTFADKNSKIKWHLNVQGGYGSMNWSLEEMLKDRNKSIQTGDLIIESVRRNSDGEVFTLGDKVIHNGVSEIITVFEIIPTTVHNDALVTGKKDHYWLHDIKKVTQKLFTTTDGVDIFEKTPFWMVTNGWEVVSSHTHEQVGFKTFSTEAAAETYVYENKPIYSVKDFRELIKAFEERIALKTDNNGEER